MKSHVTYHTPRDPPPAACCWRQPCCSYGRKGRRAPNCGFFARKAGPPAAAGPSWRRGRYLRRPRAQRPPLGEIELFPTPVAPQQRFLQVRELQDLLASAAGREPGRTSVFRRSQVAVQGAGRRICTEASQPGWTGSLRRRPASAIAGRRSRGPILEGTGRQQTPLDVRRARSLGRSPLTDARNAVDRQRRHAAVDRHATFELVIVHTALVRDGFPRYPPGDHARRRGGATRALNRGALIHAGDVELQTAPAAAGEPMPPRAFTIWEVVGRERPAPSRPGKS